tara:strand:+ start:170 stop:544 length:375 start_codon:yes stop_codon:yes gene_type:complete
MGWYQDYQKGRSERVAARQQGRSSRAQSRSETKQSRHRKREVKAQARQEGRSQRQAARQDTKQVRAQEGIGAFGFAKVADLGASDFDGGGGGGIGGGKKSDGFKPWMAAAAIGAVYVLSQQKGK